MTVSHQEHVSSFEAIINSIKYDAEVCRWFEFLIAQPAVSAQISAEEGAVQAYRDIQRALLRQRVIFAFALASVMAVILSKSFWPLLAVPFILYFWFHSQKVKAAAVVAVSERLISRDYVPLDILSGITLFQLSEQYSKKYKIASLVDKIYCFDRVKRYSVLVFLVVVMAIWTVAFSWKAALVMLCYYELIKAALMTTVVYRRLQ
jgi:hypothetical protein